MGERKAADFRKRRREKPRSGVGNLTHFLSVGCQNPPQQGGLKNSELFLDFAGEQRKQSGSSLLNAENDTPDLLSGWADGPNLSSFGYSSMHLNDYNYQTDWSN